MSIHFGTDGWRAVISDEFTFANVRHVAQAIADSDPTYQERGVVVGFDTRFLSDRYAAEIAQVLAGNGIPVCLSTADAPTPAISFAIPHLKAAGGVMVTASHNPPRYNGMKLKTEHGSAASPEGAAASPPQPASTQHNNHELLKFIRYLLRKLLGHEGADSVRAGMNRTQAESAGRRFTAVRPESEWF